MANEVDGCNPSIAPSGSTCYFTFTRGALQANRVTSAYVVPVDADWDDYCFDFAERAGMSDARFFGSLPAWAKGDTVNALGHVKEGDDRLPGDPVFCGGPVSPDIYDADIDFRRDSAADEYTVVWFCNGVAITCGLSAMQIQVVKRADGSDLVAATNMTDAGGGLLKYNEATNRATLGEAIKIIATATIDGVTRTWMRVTGRDVAS